MVAEISEAEIAALLELEAAVRGHAYHEDEMQWRVRALRAEGCYCYNEMDQYRAMCAVLAKLDALRAEAAR